MSDRRRAAALARLEGWLGEFPGLERLGPDALRRLYPARALERGWRIPGIFPDGMAFDVLLTAGFPFQIPRIAIAPAPPKLRWPHVEEDGVACLVSNLATHAVDRPEDVVAELLDGAYALARMCRGGAGDQDFEDEFQSYWWQFIGDRPREYLSLVEPRGPSRLVYAWYGRSFTLLADSEGAIRSWVENRFGNPWPRRFRVDPVPLLWLPRPPRSTDFPRTAQDLVALAAAADGGVDLLRRSARGCPSRIAVLVGADARSGPGLIGVRLHRPEERPGQRPSRGFRPGRMPGRIALPRYGRAPLSYARVTRVDAPWVHGRGRDAMQRTLSGKSVVVVGCGSLGAGVARLLAQSGVGALTLVDPDLMAPENASRHELGVADADEPKARQLGLRLRRHFPEMRVGIAVMTAQRLWQEQPERIRSADLVVSTTGDWPTEAWLNTLSRTQAAFPPVLYGWVEPHAAAAHAVASVPGGHCLECVLDDRGLPRHAAARWPGGAPSHAIPACGGMFQPYGAVELAHAQGLVADAALAVLLGRAAGSRWQAWVGRLSTLSDAGGAWSEDWCREVGDPGPGGRLVEVPWRADPACPACGAAA